MEGLFKRISNYIKRKRMFKEIKEMPDEKKVEEIEKGGISKPESLIFALKDIDDKKTKIDYINTVINNENIDRTVTNSVIKQASDTVLAEVYKENPNTVKDALATDRLSKILQEYSELFKIAEQIEGKGYINDFDFYDLIKKTLEKDNEIYYNVEELSKTIAIRLAKNTAKYEKPLHYQNLVELLKKDEDKLKLPQYVEDECKTYKEKLEKMTSTAKISKKITNLEKFNKEQFKTQIEGYLKSIIEMKMKDEEER